jgi:hypothetical protein
MMKAMSDVPAPIGFPLNLDARPITAYAQNIKQFSVGLQLQAQSLVDATRTASPDWNGMASSAFATKMIERASKLMQASEVVDGAPDVLIQYAETIRWAQDAHADALRTYYSAWNNRPYSDQLLQQCVTIQQQVIDSANTAANQVAAALQTIKSYFIYLSTGLPLPMIPDWGAYGQGLRGSTPEHHLSEDIAHVLHPLHLGVEGAEAIGEPILKWMEHREHAMKKMIETHGKKGGKPFMRGGRELLAWKRGVNLTATEGTLAQATARMTALSARINSLKVGLKFAKIGGPILGAALQTAEDWDKNLTTGQRVTRTGTAVVMQGVGLWAGAEVGALMGAPFGGFGAVPGAIIGGLVGIWLGDGAKEELFEHGPEGVFGGK